MGRARRSRLSCLTHRSLPSLKSNAAIESVSDSSIPVVDRPVPTYSTPRFASMVGEETTAAPGRSEFLHAGAVLARRLRLLEHGIALPQDAAAGDVERRDTAAKSAAAVVGIGRDCCPRWTPPRHTAGRCTRSGAPTMRAVGWVSTCVFHSSVPFCASSAYTAPVSSPKNAALGALMTSRCASVRFNFRGIAARFDWPSSPIEIAVRLPAGASKVQ